MNGGECVVEGAETGEVAVFVAEQSGSQSGDLSEFVVAESCPFGGEGDLLSGEVLSWDGGGGYGDSGRSGFDDKEDLGVFGEEGIDGERGQGGGQHQDGGVGGSAIVVLKGLLSEKGCGVGSESVKQYCSQELCGEEELCLELVGSFLVVLGQQGVSWVQAVDDVGDVCAGGRLARGVVVVKGLYDGLVDAGPGCELDVGADVVAWKADGEGGPDELKAEGFPDEACGRVEDAGRPLERVVALVVVKESLVVAGPADIEKDGCRVLSPSIEVFASAHELGGRKQQGEHGEREDVVCVERSGMGDEVGDGVAHERGPFFGSSGGGMGYEFRRVFVEEGIGGEIDHKGSGCGGFLGAVRGRRLRVRCVMLERLVAVHWQEGPKTEKRR